MVLTPPVVNQDRQPVHTVYGGAQLFKAETPARLGALALELIRNYAPDAEAFAECLGLDNAIASAVFDRVMAKLEREPVEDFRIDFEDGYGYRSESEEDGHARSAARALNRARTLPQFPPFIGIRIKPLTPALRARARRTLDLFFGEIGDLPENFAVTLPKVTEPGQVAELADLLDGLEAQRGMKPGAVKIELMIEAPEAIFDASGCVAIPKLIAAARGRCRGLHFGPYDYSASCGIAAAEQRLDHPACDFARNIMQVAAAPHGVMLADGPSTILPIPRHRTPAADAEWAENRAIVHRAMRHHFDLVQRSLANGFYQGWDLHPGQLPTRYAAVFAFFLQSRDAAASRLKNFINQAAQATRAGEVFDDAATGQGLLNFLLRGVNCGALTPEEAAASGLTMDELRSRSFAGILESRKA